MNREELLEKLNLISLEELGELKSGDKFKMRDEESYLYYLSRDNLGVINRRNGRPKKFFRGNPFTFENINNYFRIHNIKLNLLTRNPLSATVALEFKCLNHDVIFERCWNMVKQGFDGCGECTGWQKPYTLDEIKTIVKSKGSEFLSNEFKGIHNSYIFKCPSCNEEYERRFDVFFHQEVTLCRSCSGITINTIDTVRNELFDKGIILHSKSYKNQSANLSVEYPCGFRTKRTLDNIKKSKYLCPHCNKPGYKRTTAQFYSEINSLVGDEYTFSGGYTICDKKMNVKHNTCGYEYSISPHRFINFGNRCPVCTTSKSEEAIAKELCNFNTKYISEYTFYNLTGLGGGLLRFDFAIFDSSNVKFLIEYDGEYHYKAIEGEEQLKRQQEHDRRKNQYCKDNNIKLYRIPYWDKDNIKHIIKNILDKEGFSG